MSMSIKKSRLFKLFAVVALAVIMAIGTALPSFASSDDKEFYFKTEGGSSNEAFIPARVKQDNTSIYCWIQNSTTKNVTSAKVNARGGWGTNPDKDWAVCNSSLGYGRTMQVGTSYFIYNNVKEAGYTYASLSFTSSLASTFRGVWSPDSVYQSGVAQI